MYIDSVTNYIDVEESALGLFKSAFTSVTFVYHKRFRRCAVVRHTVLLLDLRQQQDACDPLWVVPYGAASVHFANHVDASHSGVAPNVHYLVYLTNVRE